MGTKIIRVIARTMAVTAMTAMTATAALPKASVYGRVLDLGIRIRIRINTFRPYNSRGCGTC
jgi:hypothetical protein